MVRNIWYGSTEAKAKAIEEWADDGSFHTKLKWYSRLRQVAVYDAYDVPTYYYFDLDGFTYRTCLADGHESWYSRDGKSALLGKSILMGERLNKNTIIKINLLKLFSQTVG